VIYFFVVQFFGWVDVLRKAYGSGGALVAARHEKKEIYCIKEGLAVLSRFRRAEGACSGSVFSVVGIATIEPGRGWLTRAFFKEAGAVSGGSRTPQRKGHKEGRSRCGGCIQAGGAASVLLVTPIEKGRSEIFAVSQIL